MPILNFQATVAGQNENIKPRMVRIHTSDAKSVVETAGYMDQYLRTQGCSLIPSDFIFIICSDGDDIYKPLFIGDSVTLDDYFA